MPVPETLLSSVQLESYTLRNHVIMAPLTRSRAGEGDAPTSPSVEYYRQRVTEGSQISPQGKAIRAPPAFSSDAQGRRLATGDAGRSQWRRAHLPALWMVARLSHPTINQDGGLPVSSSAIAPEGEIHPHRGFSPMRCRVRFLIERFRTGAPLSAPDPATFYQGEAHGYTDYPTLAA